MQRLFTWEGIILGYLALVIFLLISGCTTTVATTVADTTYSSSFSLQKFERRHYD